MDEKNEEKKVPDIAGDEQENIADRERRVIKELQKQYYTPQVDEAWCIIDAKWLKWWKDFTSFSEAKSEEAGEPVAASNSSRPGPIVNSHLLEENSQSLRRTLIQNEDYEIIHEKVWDTLCDWYTGGPTIKRFVVQQGVSFNRQNVINLYPIFLKWGYADDSQPDGLPKEENRKVSQVSRTLNMKGLREYLQNKDVDPEKQHTNIRLNMPLEVVHKLKPWFYDPTDEDKKRFIEVIPESDFTDIEEIDFKGHELHVVVSQEIKGDWTFETPKPYQYRLGEIYDMRDLKNNHYVGFIRGKNEQKYRVHYINWKEKWDEDVPIGQEGEKFFPRSTYTNGYHKPKAKHAATTDRYASNYSSSGYNPNEEGSSTSKGIVGLRNLGNTCFMNSTLQCLMQSPWLSDFFINGDWLKDINRDNALGKDGRVAEQYGALVRAAFSNTYRVIAPREFKRVIGEFAPQFMGYQQQDSQELLAFLLDGLHEDLNRIKNKPYTESKENSGREDNIVANETWEIYKKRNNSIIVDLLQGQYKSKLICPSCNRTSITFDPFMYLTVPLPTEKYKIQRVTWVPGDGKTFKKYGIKVLKSGNVGDLKRKIVELFDVDRKWLALADIWREKVHKIYQDTDPVNNMRGTVDIWAYHAPPSITAVETTEDGEGEVTLVADEGDLTRPGDEGQVASKEGENKPRYFPCPIHNVAKNNTYTYSMATPIGIPPLFISLPGYNELTSKDVFKTLCDQLELYGFWKRADEEGDNFPFTVTYCPETRYGFARHSEKDLKNNDEKFSISGKVQFSLLWKSNKRHEVTIDKDESFPEVGENSNEETVELSSCLSAFTEAEVLSKENAWYCNVCKDFQMASKKMELWRLPDLLVIHLKRFSFTRHYRNKIQSLVRFPLKDLDLKDWVSPKCKLDQTTVYDLYATSMHSGGMGGGHYTAYAQSVISNEWYYLNDSSVSKASQKSTQSPCAYLLFYKRKERKTN